MSIIITPSEIGKIITVPVKSRCNDGRKIPKGIDLNKFMQMNVYRWREESPYFDQIFVYNPFPIHPIVTRSIVDSVDPNKIRYSPNKYHKNSWYHLPRVFDNKGLNLNPITTSDKNIVVIEEDMPKGKLYFQYNSQMNNLNLTTIIELSQEELVEYLQNIKQHEVFCSSLEQKVKH